MRNFIKSIPAKLRHNFWMKMSSLALAFLVWVIVVTYYNPETSDMIKDIPIGIDMENSVLAEKNLILVSEPEGTVDIEIEGRREALAQINKDKIVAMVSLASVTKPGEHSLPVNIVVDGKNIKTVSQSVERITLKFENAVSQQFVVDVITKGDVPEGFTLERVANPTVVTVTGPESVVSKIAKVQAIVSQNAFTESAIYDGTIMYLDKDGEQVPGDYLSLDTDGIKVNVLVNTEKTVPLQVELTNSAGGNDKSYLKVNIEPETIKIAGSADTLESINSVSLGLIDLAEIENGYSNKVAVILPNGVKNVDDVETVKITVNFDGTLTKRFTIKSETIKPENVSDDVKLQVQEPEVVITVRGDAADINKLTAKDISLKMDCKNQEWSKGSLKMPISCVFPADYKVGAVGKYEVTVKVIN